MTKLDKKTWHLVSNTEVAAFHLSLSPLLLLPPLIVSPFIMFCYHFQSICTSLPSSSPHNHEEPHTLRLHGGYYKNEVNTGGAFGNQMHRAALFSTWRKLYVTVKPGIWF